MPEPKRLSVPTNPARALRDLNRQHAPPPDNEEDYTTTLQTDKPTDSLTNTQTDQPTNRPSNQATDIPTNQQTDQPPDKPSNRPTKVKRANPVGAEGRTTATPQPVSHLSSVAPHEAATSQAPRADGRTMRPRQETADRTLVTSLRLAVSTVEQLDEYCWRHRQRKQDVVQAALDLYFATTEAEER